MTLRARIKESLTLIGRFVTVENLRLRGNISAPVVVVEFDLNQLRQQQIVRRVGDKWGMAGWNEYDGTQSTLMKAKINYNKFTGKQLAELPDDVVAELSRPLRNRRAAHIKRNTANVSDKFSRTVKTMLDTPPVHKQNPEPDKPLRLEDVEQQVRTEEQNMPKNDLNHKALQELDLMAEAQANQGIEDAQTKIAFLLGPHRSD